jgi:hypothetical protein
VNFLPLGREVCGLFYLLYIAVGMIGDVEYLVRFLVAIDLSSIEEQPLGDWVQLSFIMNELEKLTI